MKLLFWLLSRFSIPPEVQGDIAEDYAQCRSLARLARQSGVAILTISYRTIRHEPLRLLTAIALGCFLYFAPFSPHAIGIRWTSPWRPFLTFTGWAMGHTSRSQPLIPVFCFKLVHWAYLYFTIHAPLRYHPKRDLIAFLAILAGALLVKPLPPRELEIAHSTPSAPGD